jgi:uncharacterized phage-associated protein
MAIVHDIAAYILLRRGPMSAMKLQKLVYYAQAWTLARRGQPLFDEQIQAWAHGPVVYELFRLHRGQFVVDRIWPAGDPHQLSTADREIVDSILDCYGSLSAAQLSDLTHREDPWKSARADVGPGVRTSTIIEQASMQRYYASRLLQRHE